MSLLPRRLRHGEEATLVEHLGELRARLVICMLAITGAFVVTYAFHGHLLDWLNQPLPPTSGRRSRSACSSRSPSRSWSASTRPA